MKFPKSQEIADLICEMSQADCGTTNMQELLTAIREALSQVMDTAHFYVTIYDVQKDTMKFAYHADEMDSIEEYKQEYFDQYCWEHVSRSEGFTPEVVRSGKPLLINKEEDFIRNDKTNLKPLGTPAKVWLGVPLKIKNAVIGVLAVQSYSNPELYGMREMEILVAVSEQIAMAIEHKKSVEIQKRNEEIQKTLFSIANAVNITLNLEALYRFIHTTLSRVMDLPNFYIALYDKEKALITFPYVVDEKDFSDQSEFVFDVRTLKVTSLTWMVIETRKTLLINKKRIMQLCRENRKELRGTVPEVWFGVPLQVRNEVIGVMCAQSYSESFRFNEKDLEILLSVSDQVAIAIDRKRADEEAQKRAERLTVLNRIGKVAATAHNLDQLMESIYEEINQIFKPDCFFICFLEQDNNELNFGFLIENEKRQFGVRKPLGKGYSYKVIHEKKPLVVLDFEKEQTSLPTPLIFDDPRPALSWVGVPFMSDNQVIGIISIQSFQPHAWNEEDLQLFFTISDQIAATIQKARLFEEARKRAERLTVINRIGNVAATAHNLDNLMEAIYDEINLTFKPDSFFIAFFDNKTNELEFRFLIDENKKWPLRRYPLGNGYSAKVIMEKKPLIIRNYLEERNNLPTPLELTTQTKAQSWIGVPLKFENQIIGLVNIQSYKAYAWNEEDIQLFFTIADQLAGSIEKARLFEEARKRLERLAVLNRIGILATSAQNINQLLNNIYEEINSVYKPNSFFIAFYHEKTGELEFKILMDEGQKSENQRLPLGKGLSAKVIEEKRPLVVNHYDKEKNNLPAQMHAGKTGPGAAQSWIGVPLMFEGQLIGIVSIQSYQPNAWNQEDQQLFFTIADQVGAVIQKARLYESVQQELNERKKAEDEKKKLEMQLRQAQKMEAIGTLAGGIAHDFNNVLYPIIGFGEMTMDLVPEDSLVRKNLDQILIAADRAKELIQQILTFSRQQEYTPQPLRIQPILKEALKLIRSSMPATISIVQKIDETCGPVMADPSQIHQIIMNLCTNAYQAMRKKGGVLEIHLTEVEIQPGMVDKPVQLYPGLYLCLTVRDTGHGIDPLIMQRIFDPYFTTKAPGEGTGMGLAVVHGIVKGCGGEIMATSQPGLGAAFQIFLPRVMEDEQETLITMPQCIPGRGERILFVDDEEQIVSMVDQMLQSLNYKVVAKTNSLEALEEFSKKPDFFDLIITDQTMPGLTGFELSGKILEIRKNIPIILCTGFSELLNEEQVKAVGIRKFILKPIMKSQLSILLREILDKKNAL